MTWGGSVTITAKLSNSIRGLVGFRNHPKTMRCLGRTQTIKPQLFSLRRSVHRSLPLPPCLLRLHSSSFPCSKSMSSVDTNIAAAAASASDPSPPPSKPTKTVRAMIKGRVQGVFYRNWTVENANELGLKGWVRNRRDGSVEALFSGDPDSVQEMEQRCKRGPPNAMVTSLQVVPSDEDPGQGFERRQTV